MSGKSLSSFPRSSDRPDGRPPASLPARHVFGLLLSMQVFVSLAFCQQPDSGQESNMSVLIRPWAGPYGGVPPWNEVRPDEFAAAFEEAIRLADADIQKIAESDEEPTFDNTMLPLEISGEPLERLEVLFDVHAYNLSVGPIPDIERQVTPKLAAFRDRIMQNEGLFKRVAAIYEGPEYATLSTSQKRLVEDQYKSFVRNGAELNTDDKRRLSQINQRLATLFTNFSQNILADEGQYITWVDQQSQLEGLPDNLVSAMSAAAAEHGQPEKWAVTNTRSSMDPFLTYAANRELREQVWRNYYSRGDNGDDHDNNTIIAEILRLRAQRAKLLGYETHAHWRLEPQMAKSPQAAMGLLLQVWEKAKRRVEEEVADMQAIADREGADFKIEPWDYRYYAEKVRKEKYDLDLNEVKPYLQLEKLLEAMHWTAEKLFGLKFQRIGDVPVFHPDVRVWEVVDKTSDQHIGLWYLDPYARVGKRSGAWMTSYRDQDRLDEASPKTAIVSNNSNFIRGAAGDVVLISWDDATTLFHEFGHALHGLLSNVTYPSQSGTNVARDYVEFPSQILEHWLMTPEVLNQFARHYETDAPIPKELVDKIERASKFNQGFDTVEYLASALIDMRLHLAGDVDIDPDAFERDTLAELGMPKEIVMRHRTPHFSHIFSGDAYSAGYYSYLWADTLTADAAEAFEESAGGYFDAEVAKRLLEHVLSVGDTIDAAEGFRRFRGRDVDSSALLRKRGFPDQP